jgi:hypothetical protein
MRVKMNGKKEIIDILSTEERRVQSYSGTIHGLIEQPRSLNSRKTMRRNWNKKHSYVVDEGKTGHKGDRRGFRKYRSGN